MNTIKNKLILKLTIALSIFILCAAYFIQYILKKEACNLCLIERLPYLSAIILIIFTFYSKNKEKLIIGFLSIIFTIGTIISFYHYGIEQGFFSESLVCDLKNLSFNVTKESILKELENNSISCKEVTFRIFNLSLATINMFISLLLSLTYTKIYFYYEKN